MQERQKIKISYLHLDYRQFLGQLIGCLFLNPQVVCTELKDSTQPKKTSVITSQ